LSLLLFDSKLNQLSINNLKSSIHAADISSFGNKHQSHFTQGLH
jgi:hypothetical protein